MNKLSKSAMLISLILISSKVLGFLREICLASQFGTSYIVDAYLICITLPEVLYSIIASGFSESFIVGTARLHNAEQKKKFFNNTVTSLFILAGVMFIFCFLGCHWLSLLLAPGFDTAASQLLTQYIQIISISLPFMVIFGMLSAQLQSKEYFVFPSFCDFIVTNVFILASIFLAGPRAPNGLVIGHVCAHIITAVLLWTYACHKKVIAYRPCIDLHDEHFKALCKLALPLGVSLMINQLNGVIDRIFSSLLGEGVTSALSYANKVQLLVYSLTTSVFISVCYPRINQHFANMDKEGGMYYIRQAALVALYISVPAMGGLFLFSRPIVTLFFERGMFTSDATALTAECLAFYALGMPFYALREIGTRALSANLQQKRILKNTILSVICNLFLNALLLRPLGHIGLAMATSLSGMFTFMLILLDMRKLELRIFTSAQLRDFGKIIINSIISLLACSISYQILRFLLSGSVAILLGICAACVTYLALSLLLRIDIVIWIYQRLPAKLKIIPWLNHY